MEKVVVAIVLSISCTLGVRTSDITDGYSVPSQFGQSSSSFEGGSSPLHGFSTRRTLSSSYGVPSSSYPRRPSNTYGSPEGGNIEPAQYQFQYNVEAPGEDGQVLIRFGHQESRVGEETRGSYYVLLPDGRVQNVVYTADRRGYHPTVSYQGGGGKGSRRGDTEGRGNRS